MPDLQSDLSVLTHTSTGSTPRVPPPKFRWKTRVLLPAVLLTIFAATMLYTTWDALWPAPEVRVVPVVTQTGGQQSSGGVAAQAAGWVEADPFPIYVSALTDGIIKEVLVLEGQTVKAGDVVVRLIDDDAKLALAQADAELARKQAALRVSKATLEAAQREWDNPVARTQAASFSAAALAESKAQLAQSEKEIGVADARVAELKEQYRREKDSAPGLAIPEYQLVKTGLQLKTEEARLEAAQGQRAVLSAQIAKMQADAAAAQDNLRLRIPERRALDEAIAQVTFAEAEVRLAQAQRDTAQLKLDRTQVRSPADGVVMTRLVSPGSKLMPNSDDMHSLHIVHLYDPQKLQVRADVPLADAAKVSVGQKAKIVVDVLPDRTFDGEVTRIVNQADLQKNTLQVKVAIEKPASELKPEMLARIQFIAAASKASASASGYRIFAPQRLLAMHTGGHAETWVVDKGRSVALRRGVQTGPVRLNDWIEIVSGLQPGDALIDNPPASLKDGQKIRVSGEAAAEAASSTPKPEPEAKHAGHEGSHK
ncbi:MAG TPA: efflux RND transporter periplasmic adaptor subunit [Planctomycetota bacterium]|jgi:RND family efflux transporter MFP subunit